MDLVVTTDGMPEDSILLECLVLTEVTVRGVVGGSDTLLVRVPGVGISEASILVVESKGDQVSTELVSRKGLEDRVWVVEVVVPVVGVDPAVVVGP